jgi:hypothetical protein
MGIERELQKTRDGDADGDEVKGMREGRTGRQESTRQDKIRHSPTSYFCSFLDIYSFFSSFSA